MGIIYMPPSRCPCMPLSLQPDDSDEAGHSPRAGKNDSATHTLPVALRLNTYIIRAKFVPDDRRCQRLSLFNPIETSSMRTLKLTATLLAALSIAACSSTPEEVAGAGGAPAGGALTSGLGNGGYDESALYAGKPAQSSSVVYFDYDSFSVGEKYRVMLRDHAAFLAGNPKRMVTIEAHSDERGSNEYNVALSEKRGNAMRDMLVLQGAGANQVSVVAYGEEKPACDEHNEACYAKSRFAELVYGSR